MKRIITSLMIVLALGMGLVSGKSAKAADPMLGTIIGAVGGGLLGSTVGKGDGRLIATAAGSVIGAVIGREVATNQPDYDYGRVERPRERVVYREVPRTKVVVVEKDRRDHYKDRSYKKDRDHPKWKRSARYGDDVLVCRNGSKRCQWYD